MFRKNKNPQISAVRHIDFTPLDKDKIALEFFQKKIAMELGIMLKPDTTCRSFEILYKDSFRHVKYGRGRSLYNKIITDYNCGAYEKGYIPLSQFVPCLEKNKKTTRNQSY